MDGELDRLLGLILLPCAQTNIKISIKKNSSFIKKLKVPQTDWAALDAELSQLNLSKYVDELITTILNVIPKLSTKAHFITLTTMIVNLSLSYADFHLLFNLESKNHIRLYSYLCIVKRATYGEIPVALVAQLTSIKAIDIAIMFLKDFWTQKRFNRQVIDKINTIFESYYDTCIDTCMKGQKRLLKIQRNNNEHFIARGQISEDRVDKCNAMKMELRSILQDVTIMAEYLEKVPPAINIDDNAGFHNATGMISMETAFSKEDREFQAGIWEDEDSRAFYEDLPDLRDFVPAIFFPELAPSSADIDVETLQNFTETQEEAQEILEDGTEEKFEEPDEIYDEEDQTTDVGSDNQKITVALDNVLTSIPLSLSRAAIDRTTIEFAFLNTKNARKKLLKTLLEVPRQRTDIIPYYARLIAILFKEFPDIADGVIEKLVRDFRSGLKKRGDAPYIIGDKIKTIRFIGELTKFRVTPTHVIFYCFKILTDDFTHHNIEVLCNLLECCGRFMFKTPENSERTCIMLDIMMRKKNVQHVDPRQILMIDNAYYQCNPPDQTAAQTKSRTPLEQYIRKLLYFDLSRPNLDFVLKSFRKLDWNDSTIQAIIIHPFKKIYKIKYSNLHLAAYLVSELARYYPGFAVAIVDATLEQVRVGLEMNIFSQNQRRISVIKFLGELCNYKVVELNYILDAFYLIIRFGHLGGLSRPGVPSPVDACFDFFRVRLVCTLLDTCGHLLSIAPYSSQLDVFIKFFQLYYFSKEAAPNDVSGVVLESLEILGPEYRFYSGYEEALKEVALMKVFTGSVPVIKVDAYNNDRKAHSLDALPEDEVEDQSDGTVGESQDFLETSIVPEDENDEPAALSVEGSDKEITDDDDDDDESEDEAQREFEREFKRMMTESLESRKNERNTGTFDLPVPKIRVKATDAIDNENGSVAFTMLTRRDAKQQTRTMQLPADSAFVTSTRINREAEIKEKKHLKELVLNYDFMDSDEIRIADVTQTRIGANGRWVTRGNHSQERGSGQMRGRGIGSRKLAEFF